MINGKRWEQFIQINLPQLDKFEFYFSECRSNKQNLTDLKLTSMQRHIIHCFVK